MRQFKEWNILGIAVIAYILLWKLLISYLPDMGILGSLKRTIASI
jgi:hypothetical protein